MSTRNATYYAGDLRRDLLDAALDVVAASGPGAVSLRALARTLGVSHAAPTHHFPDKTALFTALAIEGFERLADAFGAAVADAGPASDAVELLRAGGLAYVRFALAHPAYFAVMWRVDLRDEDDPHLDAASGAPLAFLRDGVRAAQRQGWAEGADPDVIAWTLWSAAHGLAALWAGGTLGSASGSTDPDALGRAVTDLLLVALR